MQFVEPIRDVRKISQIKNLLQAENNIRDLLLFELGINSALRISDLLTLQVKDLLLSSFFGTSQVFDISTNKLIKRLRYFNLLREICLTCL